MTKKRIINFIENEIEGLKEKIDILQALKEVHKMAGDYDSGEYIELDAKQDVMIFELWEIERFLEKLKGGISNE